MESDRAIRGKGVTRGQRRSSEIGGTEALAQYARDLRRNPPLAREDETPLAIRAAMGDAHALEHLLRANLRFVVYVAGRYRHHGLAFEDLVAEGNMGLVAAAQRFDPARGIRFTTYAEPWIRHAMLRALAAQRKSQGREKFTRERETSAGPVSVEARPTLVSFDACLGPDATSTWSDVLPDEAGIPADQVVLGAEMRHAVSAALDSLIDRDAAILRSYFGLDGGGAFSVREIARRMGLATSDVSRRIQAALTHLRCSTEGRALLEFVA